MDVLDLARLQFASTTIFHFIFVPISIGLSLLVAIMQTIYVVKNDEKYKRDGEVLGNVPADQLCGRDRYGDLAGIPIRHELVRIFTLRRGYLRRSTCH